MPEPGEQERRDAFLEGVAWCTDNTYFLDDEVERPSADAAEKAALRYARAEPDPADQLPAPPREERVEFSCPEHGGLVVMAVPPGGGAMSTCWCGKSMRTVSGNAKELREPVLALVPRGPDPRALARRAVLEQLPCWVPEDAVDVPVLRQEDGYMVFTVRAPVTAEMLRGAFHAAMLDSRIPLGVGVDMLVE